MGTGSSYPRIAKGESDVAEAKAEFVSLGDIFPLKYRKDSNNCTVCHEVPNPFSGKRRKKITAKSQPLPPFRDKKTKYLELAERGKPNDIAHGSIFEFLWYDGCNHCVNLS